MKINRSLFLLALSPLASHGFAPLTSSRRTVTRYVSLTPDGDNSANPSGSNVTPNNINSNTNSNTNKEANSVSSIASSIRLPDISNFDFGQVLKNVQEGEVGERGETYFAVQAVLILFILVGGVPVVGEMVRTLLGPTCLLGGAAVAGLSLVDLGSDSLTPFPKPTGSGTLKTEGIYSEVRHPMYAGLLAIMFGLSIATNSADRLLLTGFLWYLASVKSDKEEEMLLEKYGDDYAGYMEDVPGKFLPASIMKELPWNQE